MTITYLNGTILQAIVLSRDEHELRAITPGCDEPLVFTSIHGTWISEEIEPVTIEFNWQRRAASQVPSVDDCICPKELAAHLIQMLLNGDGLGTAGADTLYVFRPDGARVAIQRTELGLA